MTKIIYWKNTFVRRSVWLLLQIVLIPAQIILGICIGLSEMYYDHMRLFKNVWNGK